MLHPVQLVKGLNPPAAHGPLGQGAPRRGARRAQVPAQVPAHAEPGGGAATRRRVSASGVSDIGRLLRAHERRVRSAAVGEPARGKRFSGRWTTPGPAPAGRRSGNRARAGPRRPRSPCGQLGRGRGFEGSVPEVTECHSAGAACKAQAPGPSRVPAVGAGGARVGPQAPARPAVPPLASPPPPAQQGPSSVRDPSAGEGDASAPAFRQSEFSRELVLRRSFSKEPVSHRCQWHPCWKE